MRVTGEAGDWEGPELAGPDGRRKLRKWAPVFAQTKAGTLVQRGDVHSACMGLMAHPQGEALLADMFRDWTVAGEAFSIDMLDKQFTEPDRMIEPWAVVLEVASVSGFFGSTMRKLVLMSRAKHEKQEETPTSD